MFVALLFSFAHADCIDWNGLHSSSHPILTQIKQVSLSIEETMSLSVGERECIVPDTCTWTLSNEYGFLERDVGTENTYIAPSVLVDCKVLTTEIRLVCSNQDGEEFNDQAEVTTACSDQVDDDNPSYWTASGGGCAAGTKALFLPLLLLFRNRRKE